MEEIQQNPTDPMVHWKLGEFYERNANFVAAVAEYRTSITFGNNDPSRFLHLARIYLTLGQVEAASEIIGQLLQGEFGPHTNFHAEKLNEQLKNTPSQSLKLLNHNNFYRLQSLKEYIEDVTETKHFSLVDVGGGIGELALFLPDAYYVLAEPGVNGLAAPLPFEPNSFDIVVCCHVLEHIPLEDRDTFLDNLCKMAKQKVILLNPFSSQFATEWSQLIYDITRAGWAKEHVDCIVPELSHVEKYAESRGYSYKVLPNGMSELAIALVFVEHYARLSGKMDEYKKINDMLNNTHMSSFASAQSPNAYLIEFDMKKSE